MTRMELRRTLVAVHPASVISNAAMAQLIVRDLEEDVKRRLQKRAQRHGRSMEAEVREILRSAVAGDAVGLKPLGSRMASRYRSIGLDEPLAELRGQGAKPASFRK